LGLGLIGLVVAGAVWIGLDGIAARYSALMSEDALVREGRIVVFRDTIRMIVANPRGVGVGQYQDRFREYQTYKPEQLFDHAHNDYLEAMAEWGTLTGLVFWTIIVFVLMSAIRAFLEPGPSQRSGVLLACIGAIVSILLHGLTDFNLQIPSNAMLFFSFVGIAAAYSFPRVARPSEEFEDEARDRVRSFVGQIRSSR
jgi:O-antigen ligase